MDRGRLGRAGRCGRLGPGVCIRLFDEVGFEGRAEFTEPEILRTSLASVILRMHTMGLGDVEEFPFIDPPDSRLVRDGYRLLEELRAVDARGRLTALVLLSTAHHAIEASLLQRQLA